MMEPMSEQSNASRYDLVVIGGSAGGLSTAISSVRSGVTRVRVLESDIAVAFPHLIGGNQLDVGFGETVTAVRVADDDDGDVVVETDRMSYRTRAVLVADRHTDHSWSPPIPLPESDRVHVGRHADHLEGGDEDVLVVGSSD